MTPHSNTPRSHSALDLSLVFPAERVIETAITCATRTWHCEPVRILVFRERWRKLTELNTPVAGKKRAKIRREGVEGEAHPTSAGTRLLEARTRLRSDASASYYSPSQLLARAAGPLPPPPSRTRCVLQIRLGGWAAGGPKVSFEEPARGCVKRSNISLAPPNFGRLI